MVSRSMAILSVLLLADDLQLWNEKVFVFTPACASVFFDSSSYCVFVRWPIKAYGGKQKFLYEQRCTLSYFSDIP